MSIQYQYINLNPFPVVIPSKGGVTTTFGPKQWSTDSWYSRFVGRGQLTKVPVGGPPPLPTYPPRPVQSRVMLQETLPVDEETNLYTRRAGIYFCKKCDLFRTGSRVHMERHLTEYHKVAPAPATPPPVSVVKSEEVAPPPSGVIQEATNVVTPGVFACTQCGRRYKSEQGLKIHVGKAHVNGVSPVEG